MRRLRRRICAFAALASAAANAKERRPLMAAYIVTKQPMAHPSFCALAVAPGEASDDLCAACAHFH